MTQSNFGSAGMPSGAMLSQSTTDMPKVDMNAPVLGGPQAEGDMPTGEMRVMPSDEMPAGGMQSATGASDLAQDMPAGAMVSDATQGMPMGSMLAASASAQAWQMDVSPGPPCGCG
jgi:hypothetical protein